MWVFIERIGDLYVGVAHDEAGRELLEITTPVTDSEIHAQFAALADYGDCTDVDLALYDADEALNSGQEAQREFFHLLRVRAMAGLSSPSDCAYVVDQVRDPDSRHDIRFLLWTLAYMGSQYEDVVAPFLDHANTVEEAEYAMDALLQMGLLDKYVDRLIEWMHGHRVFPNTMASEQRPAAWPQTPSGRARTRRYFRR